MVRFTGIFLLGLCIVATAPAQLQENQLKSKIADIRYPPLAAAARVQGDVHLNLTSGAVKILGGPPLLAQVAIRNAESFGSIDNAAAIDLTYHFILADPTDMPVSTTVKKGDAFDRLFLRMFGLKTEKTVVEHRCQEGITPANDIKFSRAHIEVWVYGSGRCLMVETAAFLAKT